jgi:hypothetical protein
MSKRKTLNVADTVATLNRFIQFTDTVDGRLSLCHAIERILHDADRYRGFRFTNNVVSIDPVGGFERHDSPDESFRHYFCSDEFASMRKSL